MNQITDEDLRKIAAEVECEYGMGGLTGGIYENFALDVARRAIAMERGVCARLCDQVADDLIVAMRRHGETDDDYMKGVVASARVCAEEIRAGHRA